MKTTITERLLSLREAMAKQQIQAYIIPTADPHLSEYPADCWKVREWASGFTGSAGTLVLTQTKAGLWTDSRYYLQATEQLCGTGIALYKSSDRETPTIPQFLHQELATGETVGFDGQTYSFAETTRLEQTLRRKQIRVNTSVDLISDLWLDRPAIPTAPLFEMPVEVSGQSTADKVETICQMLHQAGADYLVLSALDEVAWTFNIRGTDVSYNPVVISYAVVSEKETVLFINPQKLSSDIAEHLQREGVKIADYTLFFSYLSQLPAESRFLVDSARTNTSIVSSLPKTCEIVEGLSPANHLKSIKNETEIAGFRSALLKDGIAMTKFFYWLEQQMEAGETVTELQAAHKIAYFRSQQPGYLMESFEPISSYGAHGAIVHYSPSEETDIPLGNESLYLLDCGGHYLDGTTDITRTIALCKKPTEQMKRDFTLALKGTISLAKCKFPAGIRGCLLDSFARKALWEGGIQYGHGTGHGIGHCLNVHEGPQSIRMEDNPVVLQAGMVMSDEPAMYREGTYGIRTENMIVVREDCETEYGKFLAFDTMTLCYIDRSLIDTLLLSNSDIRWFNGYHNMVYEKLSPHLTDEESEWLEGKTWTI